MGCTTLSAHEAVASPFILLSLALLSAPLICHFEKLSFSCPLCHAFQPTWTAPAPFTAKGSTTATALLPRLAFRASRIRINPPPAASSVDEEGPGRRQSQVRLDCDGSTKPSPMGTSVARSDFFCSVVVATTAAAAALSASPPARAFEGGVGGLGKTKPQTGITYRDPESVALSSAGLGSNAGEVTNELLAPDGTPAYVTYDAPWPLLRSSTGIESRDLANPEAAFVQVAKAPRGIESAGGGSAALLRKDFFLDTVFGQAGKFGAYGTPTDIKVKPLPTSSTAPSPTAIYLATFTTLTPAMRESERKAYISTSIVGDGVFMLVTGSTSARFGKLEGTMRKVAESFQAVEAPKSSLRSGAGGA